MRHAYSFVPLGFAIWMAHYLFHFLTGAMTIVPAFQTFFQRTLRWPIRLADTDAIWPSANRIVVSTTSSAPGTDNVGSVQAISAETGQVVWNYQQRAATMALAATGGGLVFGGDVNGRFRAFDDRTGEILWEINLGSPVSGFPITYAVDGRQYVAISTGFGRFLDLTPELRPSANNNLFIFALPE